MIKDCKAVGNPLPKYEEVGGSFSVTFPLKEPMPTVIDKRNIDLAHLNDRQKEILEILEQGSLNRNQIMKLMKNPPADRTLQVDLLKLKTLGLIDQQGKARAIVWFLNRA